MSNDNRELVSAMMDGELDDNEVNAIESLTNDREATDVWQRYHLIRDAMHNNLPTSVDQTLAANIQQAIAEEPTVLAPRSVTKPAFLKPVAGFAIAASVTAAVLLGVQNFQQANSNDPTTPIAGNQPINQALIQPVTLSSQQPDANIVDSAELRANARMNRYLMNYNELRAGSTVQGMPPYVRMIGYEAE